MIKGLFPATRTTETQGNYQMKVIFKHVQTRLVASNGPLLDHCQIGWGRKVVFII